MFARWCVEGNTRFKLTARYPGEEESVKCSFVVSEVTQKKIILWMKCVISYTYAVIMVIAFTLRRCHEYLADITRRIRYSRTVQHNGRTELCIRGTITGVTRRALVFMATMIFFQRDGTHDCTKKFLSDVTPGFLCPPWTWIFNGK